MYLQDGSLSCFDKAASGPQRLESKLLEQMELPVDTVGISFCLSCTVKREAKDRWVTGCPALDLYSQGKTEDEAKRCLEEAISLWVEDCIERGTLDRALQEVGFHKIHPSALRPGDDHIAIYPAREAPDADAETFSIHLTIPAYQAAAFLSAQG